MAATNVQAFSGDVEVASNLAVDTNTLFVDSENNKVGVGTDIPVQSLHVSKVVAGGVNSILVSNPDGTANSSAALKLGVSSEDNDVAKFGIIHERKGTYGRGDTYFCTNYADDTTEVSESDMAITILGSNKNVGIGTTEPKQMFEVASPGYGLFSGRLGVGNLLTSAQNGGGQDFWSNGTSAKLVVRVDNSANPTATIGNASTYAGIAFVPGFDSADTTNMGLWGQASGENPIFYIQNQVNLGGGGGGIVALQPVAGYVGIGTSMAANQLHIFKSGTEQTNGVLIEKQNNGTGAAVLFFGVMNSAETPGIPKGAIFYERNLANGRGDLKFCNDAANDAGAVTSAPDNLRMIIKNNGNVGIGTTNPTFFHTHIPARDSALDRVHFTHNIDPFTGLEAPTSLTSRGQLVLTSQYSDLVIASVGTNNNHGSTLSFVAKNPTSSDYRKFVVNQGNWGNRMNYLDFGCVPTTISDNPHGAINSTQVMLTLNGADKRVGIGEMSPTTTLQVTQGNSSFIRVGPNSSYTSSLYLGAHGGGGFAAADSGVCTTNGNLHLDAGSTRTVYVNYYSGSNFLFSPSQTAVTSDDRVKTGEKYIENALTTLKKLKPQTYIHYRRLNDETADCVYSTGLIAQEIYYQCPELKHIVKVPDTAHLDLTKEIPDDPQVDPDYSDWGEEAASVGYMELIPYTISAIKQLSNEGTRHKVRVSNISFSNVLEYHGLVVSKNSDVYVSNVENDKRVYGVISDVKAETNDSEVLVNYRGDGKIWVINTDNIQAGDYITTSNVPGYAKKQEGDTLRSYTIAKSSIDCDFTQPMIDEKRVVQTTITTSRWKNQSNVLVSEATYSNLSDDVRYTDTKVVYKNLDNNNNQISQEEYDQLNTELQNNYTQTTITKYFYKKTRYLDYYPNISDWIEESISKTVDSLDDNGQLIWENTGTQVSMYPIKYLTSDGTETDQSNATFTAALINCSIVGG